MIIRFFLNQFLYIPPDFVKKTSLKGLDNIRNIE